MKSKIIVAINALSDLIKEKTNANDALKMTQAVLNLSHALMNVRGYEKSFTEGQKP